MNQPAKSQEPSMEEILASIRRIIAEDDARSAPSRQRSAPAIQPPPPAYPAYPPLPATLPPSPTEFLRDIPPAVPSPVVSARVETSPFVERLTRARVPDYEPSPVRFTPLDTRPAGAFPDSPFDVQSGIEPDESGVTEADRAEFKRAAFDIAANDDSDAESADADSADPELSDSGPADSGPADPGPANTSLAETTLAETTLADVEAAEPEEAELDPLEQARRTLAEQFDQPLLSRTTTAAVDTAFASLANTVFSQNARTLDDLVKEMLRPMLKAWLDDNLPSLVERLVRAEIERVSRGR